jgi:hypothetical protein
MGGSRLTNQFYGQTQNGHDFDVVRFQKVGPHLASGEGALVYDMLYVTDREGAFVQGVNVSALPRDTPPGWYLIARDLGGRQLDLVVRGEADRVWLVEIEDEDVIGAVDFATGDAYPEWGSRPAWATPSGGRVLADRRPSDPRPQSEKGAF